MGVGKTTLIDGLARALSSKKTALLDGDAISLTYPGGAAADRLALVEDNLISCAENFRDWGADYLCTCWIFLAQRRLDHVVRRLEAKGIPALTVALYARPEQCAQRLAARTRPHTFDAAARRWLEEVADATVRLHTDVTLDTTTMSQYDVVSVLARHVRQWDALAWAQQ